MFTRAWILIIVIAPSLGAAEFHVTVSGTPAGDGSVERPWDLATAVSGQAAVSPGDVIWLHEGVYRGGFESRLQGAPESPIVVRGRPRERVTIDLKARDDRDRGVFSIQGADAIFRDLEVTCSDPRRSTEIPGSWPEDIRRGSIDVRGDRIHLVNLVIHDLSVGVGFWSDGEGGEITGCLIYHNGWQGPDRAHGHGIYTQNLRGTKQITDNIVFHQFSYGIHAYGSEKASLCGFDIAGNFAFENGCLGGRGEKNPGILVGGGCPVKDVAVCDNVIVGGGIRLGYSSVTNEDVVCRGNYCEGGLFVRDFRRATVQQNTVVAHSKVVTLTGAERLSLDGLAWDNNQYFVTDGRWGQCSILLKGAERSMLFDDWRKETGLDAHTRFTKGMPSELRIIVRPNRYEHGRAHVAILNPADLNEVRVNLAEVLKVGEAYRIVSAKNFFGEPVASGTYEGMPISISMKSVVAAAPIGMPDFALPATEPRFAAFVIIPSQP